MSLPLVLNSHERFRTDFALAKEPECEQNHHTNQRNTD